MQDKEIQEILDNLKDAYSSYIRNKEMVIGGYKGGIISLGAAGLVTLFGTGVGIPLGIGFALSVGIAEGAYRKKLLQMLSGELGDIKEIEKHYIKLPKEIREKWASNDVFDKLAIDLKTNYCEDKIYYDSGTQDELDNGWVSLEGDIFASVVS